MTIYGRADPKFRGRQWRGRRVRQLGLKGRRRLLPCGGQWLEGGYLDGASAETLQPAPYARAVATIDIAELALEIGFLSGHDAVADDEREGQQGNQQPEIVESDA